MEELPLDIIISEFYMEQPPQNILKHIGQYAYNLSSLLGKGYSSSVYKGTLVRPSRDQHLHA